MKIKPLSPEMAHCKTIVARDGGVLHRSPGEFWRTSPTSVAGPYFGTTTVEALVARGEATYTRWQESDGGRNFPVEMTLKQTL